MAEYKIDALVTTDSENKFFLAFEKVEPNGNRGVCFHEFDKNSTAISSDVDFFGDEQIKFPSQVYGGGNVAKIWLYANKQGSHVTITIVTAPENNKISMFTASKAEGGDFIQCDPGGTIPEFNTTRMDYLVGFYYNDNTKNKFFNYKINDQGAGGHQDH